MDSGSREYRNSSDKYSFFELNPLQKFDLGFATQAHKGDQMPFPVKLVQTQATCMAEDPATFKQPKMDIPIIKGKKQMPQTHNLKLECACAY